MKFLKEPPVFTEEQFKELVHYTDLEDNPTFEAYKSNAFFKIYSGAKGVSKSFSRMIETVYRLVNEKNFNSFWCRNQYNHIKGTLKPLLEKVLSFLAAKGLDYRPYISIYNTEAYWDYDDSGKGRAIFFDNWKNVQSFQGVTLSQKDFAWGELVIDEPIEKELTEELEEIYKIQASNLEILIANTVLRSKNIEGFKTNVTFLYNIFTIDHFLIKDFHNPILPLYSGTDFLKKINLNLAKELIENTYLQKEDLAFKEGMGIIVTMFSKYFVPKNELSDLQLKQFEALKTKDYKLWMITVAGFAFEEPPERYDYFMKSVLLNKKGNWDRKKCKIINIKQLETKLENEEICGLFYGFDYGLTDNCALVVVLLLSGARIIVLDIFEDIKKLLPKNKRRENKAIYNKVALIVKKWNEYFDKYNFKFYNSWLLGNFDSFLYGDNVHSLQWMTEVFINNGINTKLLPASRFKGKKGFGIIDRQVWQKNIFENGLVELLPKAKSLLTLLCQQVIDKEDPKNPNQRNERINKKIYDVINAFEMANTLQNCEYRNYLFNKELKEKNEQNNY